MKASSRLDDISLKTVRVGEIFGAMNDVLDATRTASEVPEEVQAGVEIGLQALTVRIFGEHDKPLANELSAALQKGPDAYAAFKERYGVD